ncbi:MAG: putative uncharacterized nin region protein [Prokaryotic dsDNA virus sp.]|nr:MAG: putative uncharacterized nin region protein [Prokaryotic dsDNA virus sp.]
MKHVVSFSGGRTSAYLVYLMEQKRKNEGWDVDYVFMDTGAEHPKTYEFVRNVAEHFGIDLKCIKAKVSQEKGVGVVPVETDIDSIGWDMTVWCDMVKKYGVPYNPGGAFCTDRMKTTPYYKYCNEKYGKGNYTSWLGIRLDEPRRLKPKDGYRYLAEISPMSKEQILGWWREMPFDLDLDEWLGNCVFCIKKGINKVAVAIKQEPEMAKEYNEMLSHANNEKRNHGESMYRGKLSFDGVAKFFEDSSAETMIQGMRVRRGCAVEQGESCEVFGCQGDLFDD